MHVANPSKLIAFGHDPPFLLVSKKVYSKVG